MGKKKCVYFTLHDGLVWWETKLQNAQTLRPLPADNLLLMDAACSRLQMMLMLRLLSDCGNCFSYTANRSEGCIQLNVMLLISGVQQTEYYNISNCLVLSSTKW